MLGVRRREPSISFLQAFEAGAAGKDDLTVLRIAAEKGCILVSHDVRTMPRYFHEFIHRQASPGLILVPQKLALYADVPAPLLTAAEDQARDIFRRAGLETVWLNCSPKLEKVEPKTCYFSDTTHLTLKISLHATNAKVRDRLDVLGTAYPDENGVGYLAYVFYDRVQELAQRRMLGHALLADVMAHEIGHLLLGSTSHSPSGIMCAHWNYDELRNVAEGTMTFIPAQSRVMRDRLRVRQSKRMDLTALVADPSSALLQ